MSKPPPAEPGRWLVLIASLPTEDPAARMRMLRTLESLGAAVMREGAYLLPDTAGSRQGLEHLAEYIAKGAGVAQVLMLSQPVRSARHCCSTEPLHWYAPAVHADMEQMPLRASHKPAERQVSLSTQPV